MLGILKASLTTDLILWPKILNFFIIYLLTFKNKSLIESFKDNLRKSYRKYSNIQIKVPQREMEQIAGKNQLNSSRKCPKNEEYEFLN